MPNSGPISRRQALRVGGGIAAGLLASALPVRARDDVVEVRMMGSADGTRVWFDPVGLLLRPGQTVRWVNADRGNSHTATAYHPENGRSMRLPEGADPWDSGYLLPDERFETAPGVIGVYDYFCIPHERAGMVGRLVVASDLAHPFERVARHPYRESASALPEAARASLPSVEDILAQGRIPGG